MSEPDWDPMETAFAQRCTNRECDWKSHVVPLKRTIDNCPLCGRFVTYDHLNKPYPYTFNCDTCEFGTDDGEEMSRHIEENEECSTYSFEAVLGCR